MPQLINFIDAIAKKKDRDVLFIDFPACDPWKDEHSDWDDYAPRDSIIQWLDENKIAWQPCGPIANENTMSSYAGSVYVDVPFDPVLLN